MGHATWHNKNKCKCCVVLSLTQPPLIVRDNLSGFHYITGFVQFHVFYAISSRMFLGSCMKFDVLSEILV